MKRFIYVLMGTFFFLAALYAAFIALIDPFYVFHMPIGSMEPLQTNSAHYVARGLIRNADYEMLICGSSMCENFHIDDANEIFYGGTGKCLKVVQHGSYSNDLRASLEMAAEAQRADRIIMALDTSMFEKSDEGYRISDLPSYAADGPSALNIWQYLLNKDIFKNAVDLIMQNAEGSVPSQDSWWVIGGGYSERDLINAYKSDVVNRGFKPFDSQKAWNNLKNVEKGVEACQRQGIEIAFFIPPYSVANWDYRDYKEELMTYKELWRELLAYPNVSIYAVQFDEAIITDFDNYRNAGHYNEAVCHTILQDINEGRYQLTTDNIDSEVDGFIKLLDDYDWEKLRERAKGLA